MLIRSFGGWMLHANLVTKQDHQHSLLLYLTFNNPCCNLMHPCLIKVLFKKMFYWPFECFMYLNMLLHCVAILIVILHFGKLWVRNGLYFSSFYRWIAPLSFFFAGSCWDCPDLCAVCFQIQDDNSGMCLLFVRSHLTAASGSCLCLFVLHALMWVNGGVEDDICLRSYVKMKVVTQGLEGSACVGANRLGIRLLQDLQTKLRKFLVFIFMNIVFFPAFPL